MGILVAIRAKVPPSVAVAQGDRYVVTKGGVLRRLETRTTNESAAPAPPAAPYTYIDVLARDCPTHRAEAQGFVTAIRGALRPFVAARASQLAKVFRDSGTARCARRAAIARSNAKSREQRVVRNGLAPL